MFGDPVPVDSDAAVFNLVWMYVVKKLDKRKKARCTCDSSTRASQVWVLDYTYTNCINNTSNCMFYALAAAEDLLIFGADQCIRKGPSSKIGLLHSPGHSLQTVVGPQTRLQADPARLGHTRAPGHAGSSGGTEALGEKLSFIPKTHEPRLYLGLVEGERVLFKRQVDDFEVAACTEHTARIVFDIIEEALTFPLKRMGLVTMFNGLDIQPIRYFIKVSCETYIDKIMEGHLVKWMTTRDIPNRPTPLPTAQSFMRAYLGAKGNPDPKHQEALATEMGFKYRSGIGQLIYPFITCCPDITFATVRGSQHSSCPAKEHNHGVRHTLKYLYATKGDEIYFWRPQANMNLPDVPPPRINSHLHDLLHDGRPLHDPMEAATWVDSNWAGDPTTRCSIGRTCLRLAGSPTAYRSGLHPTVEGSSTEAKYAEANTGGKLTLFHRSILYDLDVPQNAATQVYEDNEACENLANACKPTTRTLKFFALAEWVDMDLLKLAR
ncbi:LOW QUALITY PROTEIN: hypothetical protein ACHAWF_007634, partial [Thalassiosira exigua]